MKVYTVIKEFEYGYEYEYKDDGFEVIQMFFNKGAAEKYINILKDAGTDTNIKIKEMNIHTIEPSEIKTFKYIEVKYILFKNILKEVSSEIKTTNNIDSDFKKINLNSFECKKNNCNNEISVYITIQRLIKGSEDYIYEEGYYDNECIRVLTIIESQVTKGFNIEQINKMIKYDYRSATT